MIHASTFDRYLHRDSLIHGLDPRLKLVATLGFILSNIFLKDGAWAAFAASGLILLGANLMAGLGPWYTLKRSFIALPFALAAFTTLFALPGQPLWSGRFLFWDLAVSQAGLLRFSSILVRSWLSVQMAILLVSVTRFPDLLHALRHLRLPETLVNIIAFMYRYLFVLADEAIRLLRARQARSARLEGYPSGRTIGWRARVTGAMAGQLLLRSLDRSDRIYSAMLARGYSGRPLTLHPHQMGSRDWAFSLALAACLLFVHWLGLQ
jgi:cobalt/nickel transport system permease protein